MKGARWALLLILILAFICVGNSTTWAGGQLQVKLDVELIRVLTSHISSVHSVAFSSAGV